MSPDKSQEEGASLESCCSASAAHGPSHAEAERLGLLSCVATSNFKRIPEIGVTYPAPFAALLRKCESLHLKGSQKGLAWKAVPQPHLPMALLAERHRDWGCLLALPPQTSKVALGWGVSLLGASSSTAPKM